MKNVFITGAASGIGAATAKQFYQQGWSVGLADINNQALAELTADWQPHRCFCYRLDVTDENAYQQVLTDFASQHDEQLHVLINNAGILHFGDFEQLTLAQHTNTININVNAVITGCYLAFPYLQNVYLKNADHAVVINLCSASAVYGTPELATYSASKFAVKGLTEALELEWLKHNINVCDILPPYVATPLLANQTSHSMQRLGVDIKPEQVAEVIYQQALHPKVHRAIGIKFGLLAVLAKLIPSKLVRATLKWITKT